VGEKILMSLNRPFTVGDMVVSISCSVGISLYPDDGDSVDVLIRKADAAMYKAKAAGKNRVGGNTSPA
jgi:diguanylate cyclase (GGDEF)-like protein